MYGCIGNIGNIGSMGKYGKCKGIKNLERGGCLCLNDPQLHFSSLFPLTFSHSLTSHFTYTYQAYLIIHIPTFSFHLYSSSTPHKHTYPSFHIPTLHIPFFSHTYASHTYPSPSPMLFRYNSKVYFTSPIPVKHIPLLTTGSSKNSP